MNIFKKKEYRYDLYGTKWSDILWYGNLENIKEVKKDLDAIQKLIKNEFKNFTNEEFNELISRFYTVYLTRKDILKILSIINDIEYNKFEKLNSKMIYKNTIMPSENKETKEEIFQIGWVVATAKDLTLNSNYNYSKKEIEQMIKNKQIISVGKYSQALEMDPMLLYQYENEEKINIPEIDLGYENSNNIFYNFACDYYFDLNKLKEGKTNLNKEIYKIAFSVFRKRLNKQKALIHFKQIILFLNDNIYLINDVIKRDENINKSDKTKYLELQKELESNQKLLALSLTPKYNNAKE